VVLARVRSIILERERNAAWVTQLPGIVDFAGGKK
jgi:hypothetical protein